MCQCMLVKGNSMLRRELEPLKTSKPQPKAEQQSKMRAIVPYVATKILKQVLQKNAYARHRRQRTQCEPSIHGEVGVANTSGALKTGTAARSCVCMLPMVIEICPVL